MTLIERFQSDERIQGVLTKIMTQRTRMRYKRDQVRAVVGDVAMREVEALHWLINPNDPPRIPKQNMTRPKRLRGAQRAKG